MPADIIGFRRGQATRLGPFSDNFLFLQQSVHLRASLLSPISPHGRPLPTFSIPSPLVPSMVMYVRHPHDSGLICYAFQHQGHCHIFHLSHALQIYESLIISHAQTTWMPHKTGQVRSCVFDPRRFSLHISSDSAISLQTSCPQSQRHSTVSDVSVLYRWLSCGADNCIVVNASIAWFSSTNAVSSLCRLVEIAPPKVDQISTNRATGTSVSLRGHLCKTNSCASQCSVLAGNRGPCK